VMGLTLRDKVAIALHLLGRVTHIRWFFHIAKRVRPIITLKLHNFLYRVPDYAALSILCMEPLIYAFIRHFLKSGDVFIDVGAHVGKYTIPAAKLVAPHGKVIALEPHPQNFALLLSNIKLNKLDEYVVPLQIAAWNREEIKPLYLKEEDSGTPSLMFMEETRGSITVQCMPLDRLIRSLHVNRIDLVKIDVEGAEVHVLQGMKQIMLQHRPAIIVETFPMNLKKVLDILLQNGYKISILDYYRLCVNLLALPETAIHRFISPQG